MKVLSVEIIDLCNRIPIEAKEGQASRTND
jgi:hypothetical protein